MVLPYFKNNVKEVFSKSEKTIYLAPANSFSVKRPVRIMIIGTTGYGKTVDFFTIMSQFPNCIFFDPQGNYMEKLKELNIVDLWNVHNFSYSKSKKRLMLNMRDISLSAMHLFAMSRSKMDTLARFLLNDLFGHHCNLTWADFERALMEKDKKASFWWILESLRNFISKDDTGTSLDVLCKGRHIIDIHELGTQNFEYGVLVESILAARQAKKIPRTPLLIGIDEMQKYCERMTHGGLAFGNLAARGRAFGISMAFGGTGGGNIETNIKSNLEVFLVHNAANEVTKLKKTYGIDLFVEECLSLGVGECYLIDNRVFGKPKKIKVEPDYWQKFGEKVTVDAGYNLGWVTRGVF